MVLYCALVTYLHVGLCTAQQHVHTLTHYAEAALIGTNGYYLHTHTARDQDHRVHKTTVDRDA